MLTELADGASLDIRPTLGIILFACGRIFFFAFQFFFLCDVTRCSWEVELGTSSKAGWPKRLCLLFIVWPAAVPSCPLCTNSHKPCENFRQIGADRSLLVVSLSVHCKNVYCFILLCTQLFISLFVFYRYVAPPLYTALSPRWFIYMGESVFQSHLCNKKVQNK